MFSSKHLIDQEGECQVDHQRTGENILIAAEQCELCTLGERAKPKWPKEDDREDQDER